MIFDVGAWGCLGVKFPVTVIGAGGGRAGGSGIRPRLQGPDAGFRDFLVRAEGPAGCPGFISLLGSESPGLTAAPALAGAVGLLAGGVRSGPLGSGWR